MLVTVLIQLLLVGLLVLFGLTFKKKSKPRTAYLTYPEQFIRVEPVLTDLPKSAVKNSHWFTHTFMRPRRKG